ncbi:MAG: ATP-binding protein [Alphaproteobacteria bacterium]
MASGSIDETTQLKLAKLHVEALVHDLEESLAEAKTLKLEADTARDTATTAQKKAEELAHFALNNPDPLIKIDCETGALQFVNPAAYNKYSDILTKGIKHPLLAGILAVAEDAYQRGRSVTREVIVGAVTYQQVVTPVLLGDVQSVTVYHYDISQLKEIEENLRQERANAEAANRAKGDFLANMSHELRTPMNGVLGMASLLKDTNLNHEQRDYVDTICNSGETLLMLLNDILDMSKIEAGQLTLEDIPFDLFDLVNDTTRLLEPLANKKNIVLSTKVLESVPRYIIGDPARIRQIITNLIGNAIKFTTEGSVTLALDCDGIADGRARLKFHIDDTGIGIKTENLDKIFNKFTQADETTTRRFGGTGLGLTVCKLLTEKMGGQIGVESIINKGSRFWFNLPLLIPDAPQLNFLNKEAKAASSHTAYNGARADFSSRRIIVVDDHPINLLFAKKLLQKFGCATIDTVENGADALLRIASGHYDMMLCDCQMPDMDGYEVSRRIRADEAGTQWHIPIVAMTANAMVGDREKCLAAGMDDYVTKPVNEARLYRVLAQWLLPQDTRAQTTVAVAPETTMIPDAPVDMELLNSILGDDMAERQEIITLFLDLAEQSIQNLNDNMQTMHAEVWRKAAHKMKGSSANFGANKLATLCHMAEEGHLADSVTKSAMLAAIRASYQDVKQFFAGFKTA